jgi:hypothetical protein
MDTAGWILGLGGSQCLALGVGILAAGTLLEATAPAPLVLTPIVLALTWSFAAWDGRRLHEWGSVVVRYAWVRVSGRGRWLAEVPLLTGSLADDELPPPLPPFLDGLVLLDAGPVPWSPLAALAGTGVVHDRRNHTVSATVPVRGRGFSLLERGEQERLVQLWGDALGGFCGERSAVVGVRCTEWSAPAGLGDHERFLDASTTAGSGSEALESYRELLAEAGPAATRHELLVTVTVDLRRTRRRSGEDRRPEAVAVEVLLEEMRLLTVRLDAAGLEVGPPLSPVATAEALRLRCDPHAADRLATRGASLALLAGLVSRYNAGPLATEVAWGHVQVDSCLHRTYWVAEWPRLDVGPSWLEPVLLHAGGVRTVALHYEPVPPSRSQRRVDRDSTRLVTDEEQRTRSGFRIGARHRRAQAAVLEREAELVSGYGELEFAGFVTVSAADPAALERSCGEYEQAAAQAGLELRALDGRHDIAFVCALPVGRGMAPRRQL